MRVRRIIGAGVAVLLAVSGAACANDLGEASPAPRPFASIPADPTAALAAAKTLLGQESARFEQVDPSGDLSFTGLANAGANKWEITGKEFAVRRVGDQFFIKLSGRLLEAMLGSPEVVEHLRRGGWVQTRPLEGRELMVVWNDEFPWNLANPAMKAAEVTKTGSHSFAGTLVLKDKRPVSKPRPDQKMQIAVELDPQGRFTRINMDSTPKSPEQATVFLFSDYGVRADITEPPANEVVAVDNPSLVTSFLPLP